ncbi:MAG: Transcription elongation protein NusA [Parcubacteria group bacterium GW2011_GWA2_47_8]|nr:MAG: Transcription elongation protein NusA [Parcubacteria group bacterium GW2011_GWA2_47_8]OHB20527.1 MAG: transcription termination factor NusA [Parcubacteria group bacterium RIFCSPHIGHO2_01_FULL_47_10b]
MLNLKDFHSAVDQIAEEKDLSKEQIIATVERAIAAAYKKEYGRKGQKIIARLPQDEPLAQVFLEKLVIDPETLKKDDKAQAAEIGAEDFPLIEKGKKAQLVKAADIVSQPDDIEHDRDHADEEHADENSEDDGIRFRPARHILLAQAKKISKKAEPGDLFLFPLEQKESYGRIAAQTAKQVIIQKIREAERDTIFNDFKHKEREIVGGSVQRMERGFVYVDLGKTTGVLPPQEQISTEHYHIGERLKVYVTKVEMGAKGPMIFLSRTHPRMLEKMFELEVPEIASGFVEVKAIAREAGSRSKIAVTAKEPGIDPIGSLVGQKGTRISTVINSFNGEKIDVIEWNEGSGQMIANALSPAKVLDVDANEATREAVAWVTPDQQSLAIGKKGQNVRLAAKLTGWKIDIRIPENMAQQAAKEPEAALGEASAPTPEPTPTEAPPTTEPTPDEQKAV